MINMFVSKIEKSTEIKNLFRALSEFQNKIDVVKKDADNPFFKSNYAPLETILPAIKKFLLESGLSFTQIPAENTSLTTIIVHVTTGEYISGTMQLSPVKEYKKNKAGEIDTTCGYITPQAQGSAITYARRYMLVSMLGLNTDKDDDGNEASGNVVSKSKGVQSKEDAPF